MVEVAMLPVETLRLSVLVVWQTEQMLRLSVLVVWQTEQMLRLSVLEV
jgi:hypothetical protein